MRIGICLALAIPAIFSSPAALAANTEAKEKQARKACLAGDYNKGVAILAELFVDTRDPVMVFNQGRCFEQNGRNEQAIDRFREYLRIATDLSDSDAASAEKHIADCQAILKKAETPQAAVAETPKTAPLAEPSLKPEPAVSPAAMTPQPEVTLQQSPEPNASVRGSGLRTAGVITAGVGGAALVTGVILNVKVNSMASDLQAPGAYSRSTESRRSSYAALAWVGYGVGGACVAGGALLYYLGWNSARTGSSSVAFLPALSPGEVGAVLKGAF